MPAWVQQAYAEYAGRLPRGWRLDAVEIPLAPRSRAADTARAIRTEGERVLRALTGGERVVALDEHGRNWTSLELSAQLERWRHDGRDLALLIGGPDGHAPAVLERAELTWSLSALTLPHALVRVVVAEQLYRASALMSGHPYHRGDPA